MNTPAEKLRPLRGIIPPLATPLASIDALDVPGLEKLIEHILGGGAHALFILGTTGEGPALSYRLRRELIERVCTQVGSRVPILVGISDSAYAESLHLAEFSAKAGASAVVAATPFYFQLGQSELVDAAMLAYLELREVEPERFDLPDQVLQLTVREPVGAGGRERFLYSAQVIEQLGRRSVCHRRVRDPCRPHPLRRI